MVLGSIGQLYHYEKSQWGYTPAPRDRAVPCSLRPMYQPSASNSRRVKNPKSLHRPFRRVKCVTAHRIFFETLIDNNLIENEIRTSAIAKKNLLLISSSEPGGSSIIEPMRMPWHKCANKASVFLSSHPTGKKLDRTRHNSSEVDWNRSTLIGVERND